MKRNVHNDYVRGTDSVPQTFERVIHMTDAYQLARRRLTGGTSSGVAFYQQGMDDTSPAAEEKAGDDGPPSGTKLDDGTMAPNKSGNNKCHRCGATDHWKRNCPKNKKKAAENVEGQVHMNVVPTNEEEEMFEGIGFHQQSTPARNTLCPHKIYVDSNSNFHQCIIPGLLENVTTQDILFVRIATQVHHTLHQRAGLVVCSTCGWYQMVLQTSSPFLNSNAMASVLRIRLSLNGPSQLHRGRRWC